MKIELELSEDEVNWFIWNWRDEKPPIDQIGSAGLQVAYRIYQMVNPYDEQWRKLTND